MTRDELIAEYARMHALGTQFRGLTIRRYKKSISNQVQKHAVKSVLDMGSGSGEVWTNGDWCHDLQLEIVKCYDPGVPKFSAMPPQEERFDMVISCDVLEHLHPTAVDEFLAIMFARALKIVWVSTCSRPAKKFFPNGENMHTCLLTYGAWSRKLQAANLEKLAICHLDTP